MTRGRSKPQDRAYVHGSVALLDHLAALFLAVDDRGGRFYFADDDTIRTSDEATVLAVLVRRA
jgi:hypothetical protein